MVQNSQAKSNDFSEKLVGLLPRLRRFALSLCRNSSTADDLVQSACVRAMSARDSWQEGTNFDAWMFRILRNLWLDQLRHRKVTGHETDVDEAEHLSAPDADGEQVLFLQQVRSAMAALPDDMREVVSLVCVEELSYREAAEILDVPVGTVMSRLARARVKLAEATGYVAS
jgi:RNA polymerase sigma-70 factor, ECF subfamily